MSFVRTLLRPAMAALPLAIACYPMTEEVVRDAGVSLDATAAPDAAVVSRGDASVARDAGPSTVTDSGVVVVDEGTRVFFETVAPILGGANGQAGACGACHASDVFGSPFMKADPDMLQAMLRWPGLIGDTPDRSRLYTKGPHQGRAFTEAEAAVVAEWIVLFAATRPRETEMPMPGTDTGGNIPAFVVALGANTIDLGTIGPTLRGQSITFDATPIGTSAPRLMLSNITVRSSTASGVHIVHPLFSIGTAALGLQPDIVDSFSNLDLTVYENTNAPLGPGLLILPGFEVGVRVAVSFEKIEAVQGTMPLSGCKAVTQFTQLVQPTLSASCGGCHGGGNAAATSAFSLRNIGDVRPEAQAVVCESTLGAIDPVNPVASRMYTYAAQNSGIGHPFKFNNAQLTQFQNSANQWILLER